MRHDNLRYAVLGLVRARQQGVHGYKLKGELEALSNDFWQVNYGSLYRLLDRLDQSGYLEATEHSQQGRPNRKVYRITERGRQTLDDWLLEPVSGDARPLRDELTLKLLFLRPMDLDIVAEQIRRQRSIYIAKLARIAQWRRKLHKARVGAEVTDLVMDAAVMRVKADLAWLEQVARLILHKYPTGKKRRDQSQANNRRHGAA